MRNSTSGSAAGGANFSSDYVRLRGESKQARAAVVYRVSDGEQTLLLLHKLGRFELAPTPNTIFLDLNMPSRNGWEVLAARQQNERLREIPVIGLTTSRCDQEPVLASGAREYICKPFGCEEFLTDIRMAYPSVCAQSPREASSGAA